MNDSTLAAEENSGSKQQSHITEAVIRIAGNSQDGIQSIGGFLARLAGRSEQDVMTFMTIPSTISGGPSIFQVRIGTGEVLSAGDDADVLLAFYQHSYEGHISSLKSKGIVLYDSDHVQPNEEWEGSYHHVGIPISSLTVEAIGGTARDKGKNIFALGLICSIFNLDSGKLTGLITEKFKGKNPKITETALAAFNAGHQYQTGKVIESFAFAESSLGRSTQVVMNGNEALAYGLIAAGVRFGAGYPITPWSDIMELLRRELPKYGGSFIQCEDEIASVSMALGAGYAGRVAVTGSSGPGISLKTEATTPTVRTATIIHPTVPTHPRVVVAPANVEDCFYTAMEAVRIAREYSTPVIILTDQAIATRIEALGEPDLQSLCKDITPDLSPVEDHKPYDLNTENGITHHLAPGTPIESGKYPVVTGLEHDEMGHPTGSPKLHVEMNAKRRKKLQALGASLEVPEVYGNDNGKVLLVGWGSTQGPIQETIDRVSKEGIQWSALHLRHIHPLPNGLEKVFSQFEKVIVVELNDEGLYGYGQLAAILRARFCDPKIESVTKTDGLTFKVKEIIQRVHEKVSQA